MKFPQSLIKEYIESRMVFALLRFPGEEDYTLYTSEVGTAGIDPSVMICFFGTGRKPSTTLYAVADSVPHSAPTDMHAVATVPGKREYIAAASAVIGGLKERGGKTVFSRRKAVVASAEPADVAQSYFCEHGEALCFIYYTPLTGLWLGATPELIVDKRGDTIRSMALAGTKSADDDTPWDRKNVEEHQFVLSHILDVFHRNGITGLTVTAEEMTTGAVRHLRHSICGKGTADVATLTSALSPTPAICGTPVESALDDICKHEALPRACYGGEIIVSDARHNASYLNLRSALISRDEASGKWIYNIFCGGGMTALSDPETEWEETELKAKSLLDTIMNHQNLCPTV